MSFLEIVLLAVGLSMDSLAVSVTGGALIQNYRHHHMLKIGCVMGIFQAGMTIAGYLAGMSFKKYITAFDHWIAFLLLLYLGGKMIYESTQEKEEDCRTNPLCYKTLCGLGIATSIDALAVGISLACIESAIALEALTIGIVTFLFSAFGVYFGNHFSRKIDLKLDLIGGLILIGIGTKIAAGAAAPAGAEQAGAQAPKPCAQTSRGQTALCTQTAAKTRKSTKDISPLCFSLSKSQISILCFVRQHA